MDRKLRTCCVCGEPYRYCPKCNEDKDKPHWFFVFHSDNCHNIYDVLTKYEWGQITGKEAKAQLENLDLSKFDDFGESYKNTINKIMSSVSELNIEEVTIESEVIVTDEISEEITENETPKRQKNRKIKNEVE